MWNPDEFRDMDFGLAEDETFEPEDDLEEDFVPGENEPFIMTILGPIRLDEAGVTLIHEHLQWAPPGGSDDPDQNLDDPMAALNDLGAFATVSGRTVVSATPPGSGRDARGLVWMAQRAPVHVIGATGAVSGDAAGVRDRIAEDLEQGMDGTGARPGVFVVGGEEASEAEKAAIEEFAARRKAHDLPVISLAPATRQREVIERLGRAGVPAGKVIVSGAGELAPGDIGPLLNEGAWLLFDGIGVSGEADQETARRIVQGASDGSIDRMLLSHGYRRRSSLTGYQGRPGFPYVIEQFAVMLLEEGMEAHDVRKMLVDNAAAALATVAAASGSTQLHREGRR